ncbi:MAG: recombination mediator RecR [Elusimicrobiota bacterium]
MKSFERLVRSFKRLPGIGPKQAERLAVHLLGAPSSEAEALAEAIREAKAKIRSCPVCFDYTENETCRLCADPGRDPSQLCVVEQPADVAAIERSRSYSGLYHVLHGKISPLHGVGPEGIRVREFLTRLGRAGSKVSEVILATDPDTEGEATALYLARELKAFSVRVTRIAQGVPLGGHLDYMDERTLFCALRARRDFTAD